MPLPHLTALPARHLLAGFLPTMLTQPLPTQNTKLKDKQTGHTAGREQCLTAAQHRVHRQGRGEQAGPSQPWERGDNEKATLGRGADRRGDMSLHLWDSKERTHWGRGQATRDRGPPPRSSRERGEQRRSYKGACSTTAAISSLALES